MEIFKTRPKNKLPPNSTWWNPQYNFYENFVIQPAAPWGRSGGFMSASLSDFIIISYFSRKKYDNFHEVFF